MNGSGGGGVRSNADVFTTFLERARQMVDEKVGEFVAAFFADSRATTKQIADRIDAISDAVLGGCDESGIREGEAAKHLRMPTSRVEALDRMRLGRPAVYAAVRAGANDLVFAPPLEQRSTLTAAIKAALKAAESVQ